MRESLGPDRSLGRAGISLVPMADCHWLAQCSLPACMPISETSMELDEGLHAPLPSPSSQTAGHIECQPHRTVTKLAVSIPRTGA